MTAATLATATSAKNRKAVIAGTIGNVLEWYDFGVYGYFATTMSQLFFPGDDKTISLLKAFAVFGVGFVMRPVGSVLFGIYGDRFGRRLALSAVIFLMAFSTVAIGLLPTYAQAGVLAPILLVVFRLLQGLSALIAQMVMIVFLSFFSGACPAASSEILPTRVRYTALSIGYNIAVAVFGGFAPFIATWLIGVTGSNLAPSYYLIAAATITFLVVLRIRETAFEPLR